jgi:formylglycine-generating enzyme required for sulfatase activity
MSRTCPVCRKLAEQDASFCTECGKEFASASQAGLELEVETSRRFVVQPSVLRFRATTRYPGACQVKISMRLSGQEDCVQQHASEAERCCSFHGLGDPKVFGFPFRGLKAGSVVVEELRVIVTSPDWPGIAEIFELPDQSVQVEIADRSIANQEPVIMVRDIHVDISGDNYGGENRPGVTLNVDARHDGAGQATIGWEPIRLRFLGEMTVESFPPGIYVQLPGGVPLELVRIRAGEFVMGTEEGQGKDDERPTHRVRIARDFYIGKFPVTQEQYLALMDNNPTRFDELPRNPVDNVSWDDVQEYCKRLQGHVRSSSSALSDRAVRVEQVRLSTEAEWEYACRAGTQSLYAFGDDKSDLPEYGWFLKNAGKSTQPVGQLAANAWGVHDMHGNVWEWCEDLYVANYLPADVAGPQRPPSGDRRVLRGGSWSCYATDCRSASRHAAAPQHATPNYGFRVVVLVEKTP